MKFSLSSIFVPRPVPVGLKLLLFGNEQFKILFARALDHILGTWQWTPQTCFTQVRQRKIFAERRAQLLGYNFRYTVLEEKIRGWGGGGAGKKGS